MQKFLLIEPIDFTKPFFGFGGANIISSAIKFFAGSVYLVGATSESYRLGVWSTIKLYNQDYYFLPIISSNQLSKPKTGSANIDFSLNLLRFRKKLKEIEIPYVLTRTYSVLWVLNFIKHDWNICFYYPGLGNPMLIGRKPKLGIWLSYFYNFLQGTMLRKAKIAFAAASQQQIDEYNAFLEKMHTKIVVRMLPTGVDMDLFKTQDKYQARVAFGIPLDSLVMCFVGRLAVVKGIPLILEALKIISKHNSKTRLLLVGDGEERENLTRLVKSLGLHGHVLFLGKIEPAQVALAIAAADVCVVSSFTEGFSNAMIEQVACGRPIVSTNVSGAHDLILEGVNGYIVNNRDPAIFAKRILDASKLANIEDYSTRLVGEKYSQEKMWRTVEQLWLTSEK